MRKYLKRTVIAGLVVLGAIQFVRPLQTNPPADPARTLQAEVGVAHPAVAVIGRACRDCHSNETTWPWYSQVAPVSWLVTRDVVKGRTAVNFSTWGDYPADRQRKLLRETCEEVGERKMPLSAYVLIHPAAKLDASDVRALCDLSRVNSATRR
jgi:hypothetical protein